MKSIAVLFVLGAGLAGAAEPRSLTYPVVGTGQTQCYDDRREIPAPTSRAPFFGQNAQHPGRAASYQISADGRTVADRVTGLTWQRSPDTNGDGALNAADKLTWAQAEALPAKLNAARFGGFNDWRLPTIKELYSLFDARGTDPSGPQDTDSSRLAPFLNTKFFKFAYGDTAHGERTIDSQYASSTKYVGKSVRNSGKLFGVNFADGRIKGYDLQLPGRGDKTFFVQCVRGNPAYGRNDFKDHGDGTITDRATGLIWSKEDSGKGMNWQDALAWVQKKNTEKYLGHSDWRMPDTKELQSIVDYTRAPDTSQSAAIDPLFQCSEINGEDGAPDFPYYWTSTTHAGLMGGGAAMYIAFGRASGWMGGRGGPMGGGPGGFPGRGGFAGPPPPEAGPRAGGTAPEYRLMDVHGAGAQRSDPKAGDPAQFPHGRGPQGDVIRIFNFVRLVRGG